MLDQAQPRVRSRATEAMDRAKRIAGMLDETLDTDGMNLPEILDHAEKLTRSTVDSAIRRGSVVDGLRADVSRIKAQSDKREGILKGYCKRVEELEAAVELTNRFVERVLEADPTNVVAIAIYELVVYPLVD